MDTVSPQTMAAYTYLPQNNSIVVDVNISQMVSCRCFDPEKINNYFTKLRATLTDQTKAPIVITVLLSIYWVLGTLGNALVIYVFGKKIKQQTSARYFIITLAVLDFLVCLLVIPGELFSMWMFPFNQDFVCKGFEWMRQSMIPITAFVLGAIAFDRYFLICMAPATIITKRIAQVIIAVLVIVGAAMGIVPSLAIGVNVRNNIPDCDACYLGQCKANYLLITPEVLKYYFFVLTAMYAIVTVTITILYAFVFLAVRRRSKRWGHNKRVIPRQTVSYHVSKCDNSTAITHLRMKHRMSKDTCDELGNGVQTKLLSDDHVKDNTTSEKMTEKYENEPNGTAKPCVNNKVTVTVELAEEEGCDGDSVGTKHSLAASLGDNQLDPPSTTPLTTAGDGKEAEQGKTDDSLHVRHRSSPEVKTAQILCLVTACFVLAYFPFFLIYFINMNDKASPLTQQNVGLALLYVLHYTNNVVNPFIYGFMNRNFKAEVRKMIDACRKTNSHF